MSNMKAVDARNLQHHLGSYLDQVEGGETLEIRRRRKVIGRLVPCVAEEPPEPWPDLQARLERIYPDGPVEPSASEILYGDRDRG
jgi:antitoxin (DNA-binding transcriptional repressor) of toxin-antitoxin stability system